MPCACHNSIMNAIQLLDDQHRRIRRVLRDLTACRNPSERGSLFDSAEELLQIHSAIEEDLFYPAVRRAAGTVFSEELYIQSRDEHKLVDCILPQVRFIHRASEAFTAKTRLTRELVEHHIENEERDLLPLAQEVLTREELDGLGARMQHSSDLLRGNPILAAQSRMFDCDRDGFRLATPFCTIVSSLGC